MKTLTQTRRPRKTDGMTLVEIIIVVAIVGILAAIGVVSWQSYLPRQRLNASARVLAVDLLEARQLAVKENRYFYAIFYPTTEQYKVFRVPNSNPCTDTGSGASSGTGSGSTADTTSCDDGVSDDGAGGEQLYRTGAMQAGVDFQAATKPDGVAFNKVYFCPNGQTGLGTGCAVASNSFPLKITLSRSGTSDSRQVLVRVSGAVSVN